MQFSNKARKAIASALAASTVLMSSAAVVAPKVASAAPHSEGCLVLSGGIVWMITNGTRRGYTSAEVFQSYGYNFSQVVAATAEDVALPVGPIMIYADGTLVKGPNDPLVYLVSGGQKRPFVSGAVFTGLGFSFANIQSAPVNTFSDLPTGANIDSTTMAHPDGVKVLYNGTVWEMTATGRMGFTSGENFLSYGYKFAHLVNANSADLAMPDQGNVPARPACTGGDSAPSGSVNVSLSGPASSTLINDQSQATLANFVFSGSGTVTGVTLKRTGISADTSISNVYLFEGGTRLTDAAAVSSGSTINFTNSAGLFSVSGSKTISVKADMAATSGETVGVQLTAVTLSSGSVGGLPVSGNNHSIATATLADVNLASALTISDTDPGNDIVVFQGNAAVTTRDVTLTRLSIRQIGSINSGDIRNFELYVDGVLVSTVASLDANGYVTFSGLSKTLTTGTRVLKVVADIIGGSGRNVQMSLRGAYDITVVDTQYNASPVVTATGSFPFGDSTTFSINAGTVTLVKASDSPSSQITVGASDVPLGRWTITAFGEAVKVETLTVAVDTTGGTTSEHTLRNGRLLINGAQYGSTTSVAAVDSHASGQSFTVNYMVNPGSPVTVEFRADMYDNENTDNIGAGTVTAVQAAIFGSSSLNNAIPQVSLGTLDVPGATVTANNLTVSSGSITLTELASYVDQTVAVPQSSYKLAQWTLTGNSAEAVNINTFSVGFVDADAWDASDDLTNVFIKYGSNTSSIKGTVADGSASSLANTWSQAVTLGVNQTMNVELWGTIASGANDGGSNDTLTAYLAVTGITASSGNTVYADSDTGDTALNDGVSGQTLTAGSGTIVATKDASSAVSALVDDSGTVNSVAWKFAAATDSFTITDLSFSLASASAVSMVAIKDGSTVVASKPAATSMSFSGLTVAVPANTNKVLTVELTMSPIGVGGGTTSSDLTTTMVAFTSQNSSGTTDASANDSGQSQENNPAGNAMYAYKAVPTVTYENVPSTSLTAGTRTIARFSVDSGSTGTVAWKDVMINISKSADPILTAPLIYDVTGGQNVNITADEDFQNSSEGSDTDCDASDTTCELKITIGADSDDNVEEQVNGKKTYEVRVTVSGNVSTGEYVSTNINSNLGKVDSAVYTGVDNDATVDDATFVWSDVSAQNHDTGTTDWQNEYLVKFLPTSSQTLTN